MILTPKAIKVTAAEIAAKESPSEASFRLVHNGAKVLDLFESTGFTWTRNALYCATTEKECLDEVARLKLKYVPVAESGGLEAISG